MSAVAQAQWSRLPDLTSRTLFAAVYDAARERTLLFGGNDGVPRDDCWAWDGSSWTELTPEHRPSARYLHVMAYDSLRERIVLFGGETPTSPPSQITLTSFETWTWDGTDWTLVDTPNAPGALGESAMVYDAARDRMVLWGGTSSGSYGQLWEFDGSDWTQVPTEGPNWPTWVQPVPMAYDASTGTTALYRGVGSNGGLWRWNGSTWTQQLGPSISQLSGYRLTFDTAQQRLLLVAGQGPPSTTPPTVYVWQASDFSWQPLTANGPYSYAPAVTFDATRGRVVFVGASRPGTSVDSSVWEWDGTQWERRSWAPPGARYDHTAAADVGNDRTFVFGGRSTLTDLWVREQGRWELRIPKPAFAGFPPTHPQTESGGRLVYDEARDDVLLVGGAGSPLEMWRVAGSQWQRITTSGPAGREDAGVVYDRLRQRVILFGGDPTGSSPLLYLDDMWAWDGTTWTELHPAVRPHPHAGHGMAYDPRRDRIVLFGGLQSGGAGNDTWEYDGENWHVFAGGAMPASSTVSMAYDDAREVVVAHILGASGQSTWQWDGSIWTRIAAATTPSILQPVLVGSPDGVRLLGGRFPVGAGSPTNATEHALRTPFVAGLEPFGDASVSPLGPLLLRGAGTRPWIGETCRLAYGPLPGIPLPGLWFGAARLEPALDLGWFGWPGRTVLISLDAPLPAVNDGQGGAIADIAIPHEPAFLGTSIHCQGFVFEPLNGELTTSNAVTLTFGVR